jgi:hypothetical protein
MLTVIMLTVIMLIVIMMIVVIPSVIMLFVFSENDKRSSLLINLSNNLPAGTN